MLQSRMTRHTVRNSAVLWAIVLTGAFVANFGAFEPTAKAFSPTRRIQRQVEREAGAAPLLIAAGDIAKCGSHDDSATAALVRDIPGVVATLGDHAYQQGSRQEFAECYDPTWGAAQERTRPSPGNHDYETRGAKAYFDYFGSAAGDPKEGYYSYDLGAWRLVVLNSNCEEVGGCERSSPQGRWLRRDLASHPATCTLAYWHHPLFSSGEKHGGDTAMKDAWELLYEAGADVVLSGHEHNYERFAPQDPAGRLDRERGIRQFIVGTGGAEHYGFGQPLATSEVRETGTFGVLVLTLRHSGYDWVFVPVESGRGRGEARPFTDAGSAECR